MRGTAVFLFALCASAQTVPPANSAALTDQTKPLLSANDANQLALRITQLMESTASVIPGLVSTSAVIAQNARQALTAMQAAPNNAASAFDFLTRARGYLSLMDGMPKPFPLQEAARRQFIELREDIDRFESYFQALLDQKEGQLRSSDRDNLYRYAEANEKLNAPAPNSTRVVFMGDSITDFWRLNEYFSGRQYINRGISGQVTGEMLGRMKADVIDLHPKAMVILAGTNDIARGVPVKTIENNLTMIGELCQANGIKPLFASILPVSDYHKTENPQFERSKTRPQSAVVEINNWMREYCRAHNYVYVDFYNALKDNNGMLIADGADDGLHPNAKGYRIMAPIAQKALDQALARSSPEEQPPARRKKAGTAN